MSKQDKPKLGEWVRFTQHMERPTKAEYEALFKAEEEIVYPKMLSNPNPEKAATVVGQVSKSVRAEVNTGEDGEFHGYWWDRGPRRTFYVVKWSIRGREFMVALEDMIRDGGDAP